MTTQNTSSTADEQDSPRLRRTRAPRARSPRQLADSARNRAEIVEAAVQVFAERGYAATTLDAVARIVGLTRPGVLHHFASKEALFAEVIADQNRWARERTGPPPTEDGGLPGLRTLVRYIGRDDASRVRLQLVQMLQGEAMSGHPAAQEFAEERLRMVRQQIGAQLEQARAAGELQPGVDLPALTTLLTAAINGLQAQWLLDDTVDTTAAIELLLDLVSAPPDQTPPS